MAISLRHGTLIAGMHIILLRDVPRVGSKWQVKKVRAGYARNFLIPQNAATVFSQEAMREIRIQQGRKAEERRRSTEILAQAATALEGKKVTLCAKTGTKGQLFAAVNEDRIAEAIEREHHLLISAANIMIPSSIKRGGEHSARITIPESKETVSITVVVMPEEEI